LRQMRDLRIAALDANMNYDSEENRNAKEQRVEGYGNAYLEGVKILYSAVGHQEPDPIEDDPLFAPVRRRAQTMRAEVSQPLVAEAGMGRKLIER
jgi:hypothetical protein